MSYKCSEVFYKDGDSGIIWNDNDIAVNWPLEMLEEKNHLIYK